MGEGRAMGNATVEVSGAQAASWAAELRAALVGAVGPDDSVSPVQVQRSAEMVIAVIGLVFSGVEVAKTITEWWSARRRDGAGSPCCCRTAPGSSWPRAARRGWRSPCDRTAPARTDLTTTTGDGQMNTFKLEVFAQTTNHYELRLSADAEPPRTRRLDRAAVDELITLVRRDYSPDATAQKVYGATRLAELGTRLAEFLDGDERLADADAGPSRRGGAAHHH